jgi:hypothetical protein
MIYYIISFIINNQYCPCSILNKINDYKYIFNIQYKKICCYTYNYNNTNTNKFNIYFDNNINKNQLKAFKLILIELLKDYNVDINIIKITKTNNIVIMISNDF